jgi:hypothetical protein
VLLFRGLNMTPNGFVCKLRCGNPSLFVKCSYPSVCSKAGQERSDSPSSESFVSASQDPDINSAVFKDDLLLN